MVNSLTELAQAGAISSTINNQGSRLSSLIQAASSGNRITRALDDIASLSAATSLSTEVSSLRAAALNVSQASSFLGVADGGINQIGGILDRLSALSVQANSGALSDSARQGLNAEFQGLLDEVNRIAGETNFNNVNLLDGSLSGDSSLQTDVSQATQASGSLNFSAIGAGDTITLNGIQLQEGVDFSAGSTTAETVSNLANTLNSDARFNGFEFNAVNSTLNITAEAGGSAGNQFTIDNSGPGASSATFTVVGDNLSGAGVFSLQGGSDAGLSAGDTTVSGTVGDSLVVSGTGQSASASITFNSAADITAGDTISIDDGEGGTVDFTFVNGPAAAPDQISIGSSLEETLENTASAINSFEGAGDFGVRQLNATVDGNQLVLQSNQAGNATAVDGTTAIGIAQTTGGTLSNAAFNNGSVGGVDVSGVTAPGFTGQIQGFDATFIGNDRVNLSVNVGGETFTATVSDTNASTNQTVTFSSENGGSFDVTLAGGQGQSVSSGADADAFASRLDQAFSSLQFSQTRDVSNFTGTGDLQGASLSLSSTDFSNTDFGGANVVNNGSSAFLEIEIGGQTFRSDDLGETIGAGEQITLNSLSSGDSVTFTNGANQIAVGSQSDSNAFADDLENAFGVNPGGGGASFQISSSSEGDLQLGIGDFSTGGLGLDGLNLLSADSAAAAFAAVGAAVNTLSSQRADVGAFQQALDFAGANIESAIQNQEAARAALTDTDIADNSTQRSLLEAARQAAISSLAQTNRLQGNLLQLIQ